MELNDLYVCAHTRTHAHTLFATTIYKLSFAVHHLQNVVRARFGHTGPIRHTIVQWPACYNDYVLLDKKRNDNNNNEMAEETTKK